MKLDFDPNFFLVSCDSNKISNGGTFVAIDGTHHRGVDFIEQAIQAGATKIVVDIKYKNFLTGIEQKNSAVNFTYTKNPRQSLALSAAAAYNFPAKKLQLIGITGTKGKSSISFMVEHIFRAAGKKTALIGGIYNKIIDEKIPSPLTTPNSDFLHYFFSLCVQQGVDTVIMEVSSHSLSLDRVYGLEFDAIGFTNLAQDHLDFHKTMEDYFQAKASLFSQVKKNGKAVINLDHSWGNKAMTAALEKIQADSILSLSQNNDMASNIMVINSNSFEGNDVTIKSKTNNETLHLTNNQLVGIPYIYNVGIAALIAQSCSITKENIEEAIKLFTGTPGRMQLHKLKNGARVFVDFAHNGPSMEAVLAMLRPLTDNLIVLFGCGGDKPKERRISMPKAAATFADKIIITEDNPRTEDRLSILKEIERNIPSSAHNKTTTIQDRKQAIAVAIALATSPSSIVAILGKGHEPYQIIGTTRHHFDDYEEVLKF